MANYIRNATERNLKKRISRKEFVELSTTQSKLDFHENYLNFTLGKSPKADEPIAR